MDFSKLKAGEAFQAIRRSLRKTVVWAPLLSLLFGITVSVSVYNYLRQRESESEWAVDYERVSESMNQIDLLLANSVLRIQSYEDNFGNKPIDYANNSAYIKKALQHSIFQRISIFQNTATPNKATPDLRLRLRINSQDTSLPTSRTDHIPNDLLERIVGEMNRTDSFMSNVIYEMAGIPRLTVILRSKVQSKTLLVFTAPLINVFQKLDLEVGNNITVAVRGGKQAWRVLGTENQGKITTPVPIEELVQPQPGYVSFNRSISESGLGLDLQFNFLPRSAAVVSRANIAGGMSLLITLLVTYLFHVLISQNRNANRLILRKTVDLEKTAHDLQEVLNEKSKFLGKVSHEIRTPLNLILGMIGLCVEADGEKKLSNYLTPMKASGEHLLSMIDDLIELAKAEASDLGFHGKRTDLVDFLGEVSKLADQDCRKKGLRMYCHIDPDLPAAVMADPSRLRQVLLNLLRNACKFTNRGHVILNTIAIGEPENNRARIRFEIIDTGVGIPPDKIEKVFDAFFQVESSAVLSERGVGLGLSIVKDIVSKLNGTVRVRANPQGGSIFQVDVVLDSPEDITWIQTYKSADERQRNIIILSSDPAFQKSFWCLSHHPKIKTIQAEPARWVRLIQAAHELEKDSTWVVVDLTEPEINYDLLIKTFHPKSLIFIGDKKKVTLPEAVRGESPILESPPSPLDVLTATNFASKGRAKVATRSNSYFDETAERPKTSNSLSILVADDDLGNIELYKAYFEGSKWQLKYTTDGLEAWQAYLSHPADILILDLRMPGMDGSELIDKIRTLEQAKGREPVPIILVTADVLEDTAALQERFEFVSVLTKPVKKRELFDVIVEMTQPSVVFPKLDRPFIQQQISETIQR